MWPVYPYPAEDSRSQQRSQAANHQYPDARAQQLNRAVVRHRLNQPRPRLLHHQGCCVQRQAASMAYTTTPVTET
jgi:hypothetical protein